jgi:Subtilisin-like serine proteases
MKRNRLLILFLLFATASLNAQIATNKYWVQFTDKENSPYSIDNPEAFLSQRAIQRRVNQGISIDEYDIPVNPSYLQAVAEAGAHIINPSKWLNGTTISTTSQDVLDAINALSFVQTVRICINVEEAQKIKDNVLSDEMKASDRSVSNANGLYGMAYDQINQLNGIILHDSGFKGEGMIIAVLDGGFIGTDTHHAFDNMREEGRLLGTRDFVNPGGSVYVQSAHGTKCLSTMGAYDPNVFVGTAPKASYYLLHTEDSDSENIIEEYNWVSGAEYADSLGVDVCSTSLGYIDFDLPQWDHPYEHLDGQTAPISIGANIACTRGMICVNSAGNSGDYPSPYIGVPADAEKVFTIGSVDSDGRRSGFSSIGPTADGRIKPDVMAMGSGTAVADDNNSYYQGNGTSFSTPVLAGMLTCFWQANPQAKPQEIMDAIRSTANRASIPDNYYGYGIPDFEAALHFMPVPESPTNTNNLINIYPNPSWGNVRVILKEGKKSDIRIVDFLGRTLFSYQFNGLNHTTLETFLNDLNAGIYFIVVTSEYGYQMEKMVKIN